MVKYRKIFSWHLGTRQVCLLSPFLSHIALEVLARTIRQKIKESFKEIKGTQIRMEETKLSFFTFHRECDCEWQYPKESTDKLLEYEFSRGVGYKVSI